MSQSRIRKSKGSRRDEAEEKNTKKSSAIVKVLVIVLIVFVCVTMLVPYFLYN